MSQVNWIYLKTVKTFAANQKVTTSYIYKLIRENKIKAVTIDGVHFIDTKETPSIQLIKK